MISGRHCVPQQPPGDGKNPGRCLEYTAIGRSRRVLRNATRVRERHLSVSRGPRRDPVTSQYPRGPGCRSFPGGNTHDLCGTAKYTDLLRKAPQFSATRTGRAGGTEPRCEACGSVSCSEMIHLAEQLPRSVVPVQGMRVFEKLRKPINPSRGSPWPLRISGSPR
jgi:hypothetical protein